LLTVVVPSGAAVACAARPRISGALSGITVVATDVEASELNLALHIVTMIRSFANVTGAKTELFSILME
jgi:hypothetical protein